MTKSKPDALDRFLTFCMWWCGVGAVLGIANLVLMMVGP